MIDVVANPPTPWPALQLDLEHVAKTQAQNFFLLNSFRPSAEENLFKEAYHVGGHVDEAKLVDVVQAQAHHGTALRFALLEDKHGFIRRPTRDVDRRDIAPSLR